MSQAPEAKWAYDVLLVPVLGAIWARSIRRPRPHRPRVVLDHLAGAPHVFVSVEDVVIEKWPRKCIWDRSGVRDLDQRRCLKQITKAARPAVRDLSNHVQVDLAPEVSQAAGVTLKLGQRLGVGRT